MTRKEASVTIRSVISSVLRLRRLPPTLRLAPKRTGAPYRPATARRSSSRSQDRPLEFIGIKRHLQESWHS